MYTSSDSLFNLIKKLTKDEQKVILTKLRKGTYLRRLFDLLSTVKTYDEKLVKERLKKYFDSSSFSVAKNTLREKILDILRKNGKESQIGKLHRLLDYIEILISKGLYEEAYIYCVKVKKEACESNLHYLVIEANRCIGNFLQYIEKDKFDIKNNELNTESNKAVQLLTNSFGIGWYYQQVMSLLHQNPNVRSNAFHEKIKLFKTHAYFNLNAADKEYPFYTACYLAMAKHFLYKFSGYFEEAFEQERIVWNLISTDWKSNYSNRHDETIGSVVNYMEALSKTNHIAEFRKQMDFAESLYKTTDSGNSILGGALMNFRLFDLIRAKEDNLKRNDIAPFKEYLVKGELDSIEHFKKQYEEYLCIALFFTEEYELAREYTIKTINDYHRSKVRPDFYDHARFYNLLFIFSSLLHKSFDDLKENEEFKRNAKSYKHFINHKPVDEDYSLEKAFISFYCSITSDTTSDKILVGINELEKRISNLLEQESVYLKFVAANVDVKLYLRQWRKYVGMIKVNINAGI
jgi:hypothetical protein